MVEFILYVAQQGAAREFYAKILQKQPVLDVDGMTEFLLNDNCKLGLMPEDNIAKILQPITPHPNEANGAPRCELYIYVDSPQDYLERAFNAGAVLISPNRRREWGDEVGYCADLDGHIIAFAKKVG